MKRTALPMILAALTLISCRKPDTGFIASGTFESDEVTVSSELNGKLVNFSAREGQTIDSGATLAVIDTVQLDLKRKLLVVTKGGTESKRPDASAQIAVIQKQIATAQTEKARVSSLIAAKAAPAKQLDDINGQIDLLKKQLASLKSQLSKASSGVDAEASGIDIQIAQIEDQIARSRIASPIKGTIIRTFAENGEFAAAGKPLFTVTNLDTLWLRAYISADQLNSFKLNQPVTVETDGDGKLGKKYPGTITWISSKAEFTPKTILTKDERANLVYAVKVAVKNDGFLRIGMYGSLVK